MDGINNIGDGGEELLLRLRRGGRESTSGGTSLMDGGIRIWVSP